MGNVPSINEQPAERGTNKVQPETNGEKKVDAQSKASWEASVFDPARRRSHRDDDGDWS